MIIFDTSALVASVYQEPGYQKVDKHIENFSISAVNFSELIMVLIRKGNSADKIKLTLNSICRNIIPFDEDQAILTAELFPQTKKYGLSFGDRACIALGMKLNCPILTADKTWNKLGIKAKIEVIR